MMNSQHPPTVGHTNTRHHPSTPLFIVLISVALFLYPSMLPQGKNATELITAITHKMPAAGLVSDKYNKELGYLKILMVSPWELIASLLTSGMT